MSDGFSLAFPPALVEAIAARAAELVLEQLADRRAPATDGRWLTVEEAAAFLRCKPQRIYELRSSRQLTPHYEGQGGADGRRGRALVDRQELEALIAVRK